MQIFTEFKLKLLFYVVVFLATLVLLLSGVLISRSLNIVQGVDISQVPAFSKVVECIGTGTNEHKCLDEFIQKQASKYDTKGLLHQLELARSQNSNVENSCHPVAHAIGRYSYTKYGNVGDAFQQCDYTCHSGCYHGVMERLFFDDSHETDTNDPSQLEHLTYEDFVEKIPNVCAPEKLGANPTQSLIFQCLHGVGHAVLYSINYDLKEGLKVCDLFKSDYDRRSCYGGAIMENVTAFDKNKRWIKQGDPHYPCNVLDAKYKDDCYMMQTSVMYELGYTDAQVAQFCNEAGVHKNSCFTSIGRDLSNEVRTNNAQRVLNTCQFANIDDYYAYYCIAGTVYALMDNTWDASYALPFCTQLNEINIQPCFNLSLWYLKSNYLSNVGGLRSQCEKFVPGNELCLVEADKVNTY